MLAAGTRLGVFEILAPLGKGGMGELYRGRDTVPHSRKSIAVDDGQTVDSTRP